MSVGAQGERGRVPALELSLRALIRERIVFIDQEFCLGNTRSITLDPHCQFDLPSGLQIGVPCFTKSARRRGHTVKLGNRGPIGGRDRSEIIFRWMRGMVGRLPDLVCQRCTGREWSNQIRNDAV
jgi:hypothetical protein